MRNLEKIDYVLSYMNNTEKRSEDQNTIQSKISFQTTDKELHQILHKLTKDGYLDFIKADRKTILKGVETITKTNWTFYYITFEGVMFIENGGYSRKSILDKRSASWNQIGYWVTAIGTGLAGLYALIQFANWGCKYFLFCHCP